MRFRLLCVGAFLSNYLLLAGVIFLILRDVREAFVLALLFLGALLSGALVSFLKDDEGIPLGLSSYSLHPFVGEGSLLVNVFWRLFCVKYGMTPGPVCIASGDIVSFAVTHTHPIKRHPVLFVDREFASRVTPSALRVILEHELGHLRLVFPWEREVAYRSALPCTVTMFAFRACRNYCGHLGIPFVPRVFKQCEQLLFWGSSYALSHYDEYAADALCAAACGEPVSPALVLKQATKFESDPPARLSNAHLQTHPSLDRRLAAIRDLFE